MRLPSQQRFDQCIPSPRRCDISKSLKLSDVILYKVGNIYILYSKIDAKILKYIKYSNMVGNLRGRLF